MGIPELLAPAGGMDALRAALHFGADAVYGGMKKYGLRAFAGNFTPDELAEAISLAHKTGKKFYVTMNCYPFDDELEDFIAAAGLAAELGADAVIAADPGAIMELRRKLPRLNVHVSTQANTVNAPAVELYRNLGCKRVILAREMSLDRIRALREKIGDSIQMETFVHGASCMAYSGRCLLSAYLTGRSGNRGECAQPCRWKYAVVEEKRPGEYLPVAEDENGTYLFSARDLCLLPLLPELCGAGIASLKIEGRMKTALYVATVARTYRKAIDEAAQDPSLYHAHMDWYLEQIACCTNRQFTTGFFYGKPDQESQIYDSSTYIKDYVYLGYVEEVRPDGRVRITQRNKFSTGETIEIMKPDGRNVAVPVRSIRDSHGHEMESAPHAQQTLYVDLGEDVCMYDILRRNDGGMEEGKQS